MKFSDMFNCDVVPFLLRRSVGMKGPSTNSTSLAHASGVSNDMLVGISGRIIGLLGNPECEFEASVERLLRMGKL